MPARDNCEPQVISALQKDGWSLLRKNVNLRLTAGGGLLYADLLIEKDAQQILIVEIKCFTRKRARLDELYHAIGQYLVYQSAISLENVPQALYLAIPDKNYKRFMAQEAIRLTLENAKIKLIVVDLEYEVIVRWIH